MFLVRIKLFGRRIKMAFKNYTLGVDFVNKTPQQNFCSIIDKCAYKGNEEIGKLDMFTDPAVGGDEVVEVMELDIPQIPTYIKINNWRYEVDDLTYDVTNKCYTAKLKNYVIQYTDPEEKKIAYENLKEVNRLIKERDEKVKE